MSCPPPLHHGDSGEVSAHCVRAGTEPALDHPHDNQVPYLAHLDGDAQDRFMRDHDTTWL
jgi:hypothetical protein